MPERVGRAGRSSVPAPGLDTGAACATNIAATASPVTQDSGFQPARYPGTGQTLSLVPESRRGASGEVDKYGMGFEPSVAHPNDQCIRSDSRIGNGGPHVDRRCSAPEAASGCAHAMPNSRSLDNNPRGFRMVSQRRPCSALPRSAGIRLISRSGSGRDGLAGETARYRP